MNYLYDGSDTSMLTGALYNWNPAHAPVNIAFVQPQTFGGSGFPNAQQDHAFVTESGPTWATGPQKNGKRIVEFAPDPDTGEIGGHPHTLVEYTGTGKATALGLAAGPGGLYFTELYRDQGWTTPIDPGARLLMVRYGAPVAPSLTATDPPSGGGENSPMVLGTAQFSSTVSIYTDSACQKPAATGTSEELESTRIPVKVDDNSSTSFYADDSVGGAPPPARASRSPTSRARRPGPSRRASTFALRSRGAARDSRARPAPAASRRRSGGLARSGSSP